VLAFVLTVPISSTAPAKSSMRIVFAAAVAVVRVMLTSRERRRILISDMGELLVVALV
jgi:hypothetical protein